VGRYRLFVTAMMLLSIMAAAISCARGGDNKTACPPGFRYYPGGKFQATRTGEFWKYTQYSLTIQPFCLAEYEASRPTATMESAGAGAEGNAPVPPAQVKKGVIPWAPVTWREAAYACAQQGQRLPTFEEYQYAATSGDPRNIFFWGRVWDCRESEKSWAETCAGVREMHPFPTGGPAGESAFLSGVHDLSGNVSEFTSTPWQIECYDLLHFVLFGGPAHASRKAINGAREDPHRPGCFLRDLGVGNTVRAEHPEPWDRGSFDDGFRCAADPGPQWTNWQPAIEARKLAEPPFEFYYDMDSGEKIYYSVPLDGSKPSPSWRNPFGRAWSLIVRLWSPRRPLRR